MLFALIVFRLFLYNLATLNNLISLKIRNILLARVPALEKSEASLATPSLYRQLNTSEILTPDSQSLTVQVSKIYHLQVTKWQPNLAKNRTLKSTPLAQ